MSFTSCTPQIPLSMHSMGSFVGHTSLYLHSKIANLFYNVTSSIASECLAAPPGNPRLECFYSHKYSIGQPMHSVSFMFSYIMAYSFCVVVGLIVLPAHISACSTLCYTKATKYSSTSHAEYKYKVFARVISPSNLSLVFTYDIPS